MSQFFKDLYHGMFWQLSRLFVFAVLRPQYKVKVDKDSDPIPRAPFIMISNHGTFFDPWLVGGYSATPLAIMMNDDGFRAGGFTRWYLNSVGAFPKKKGAHDFTAMKKTLSTLKRGKAVLIFPEGQTTWDGSTQPIFGGIEKIVKRAGCSLCMSRIKGNFLSKPWWASSRRKGSVSIRFKTITPEQIAHMSAEQILQTIIDYIRVNEIEDPRNSHAAFRGKDLAEGLDRLVWLCPRCKKEDTLMCRGNTIRCESCSLSITIDAHGRLFFTESGSSLPANLYEWMIAHKRFVETRIEECESGEPLTSSSEVSMQLQNQDGDFTDSASGTLRLSQDELSFIPTKSPDAQRAWRLNTVSHYVIQKKDIFEFHATDTDEYIRFVFDHKSPMKWIYYLRYLNGYEECERKGYK